MSLWGLRLGTPQATNPTAREKAGGPVILLNEGHLLNDQLYPLLPLLTTPETPPDDADDANNADNAETGETETYWCCCRISRAICLGFHWQHEWPPAHCVNRTSSQ